MKIKEFAERLLFGQTLQDKLASTEQLEYNFSYEKLADSPMFPGRPYELSLENKTAINLKFPSIHELDDDKMRGYVMHFFANHELLAIELMALAILKFPDAPASFHKGLIKTIVEEQKHMGLYCKRMQELGVAFGELAVNSYFWDSMKSMKTPLDYVVQMCLTFEQANLDFSWQYKLLFEKMGDEQCANVMQEVFQDEVGHVGLGVKWFQQWKSKEESEWDAYVRLLPFPLTPARGKGKIFYDFVRKKTGLGQEFIENMRLYSHSKGRVPFVFLYNPECERECGIVGNYTPSQIVLASHRDLSALLSFLCVESDVVVLPQNLDSSFLKYWQSLGLRLPQFLIAEKDADAVQKLVDRKVRGFRPWGWTERLSQLEQTFKKLIPDKTYAPTKNFGYFHSKENSSAYYDKWQKQQGKNLLIFVCSLESEVYSAIQKIRENGFHRIIFKSAFGVAAVGNKRYFEDNLNDNQINWIRDVLRHEAIVVEPWYERVCDFSLLYDIRDNKVKFQGLTRLLNTYQGQYRGTCIGKVGNIFPENVVRELYDLKGAESGFDELLSYGQSVCEEYKNLGYCGPLSIDGYAYLKGEKVFLYHCAEINSRYSMGRVAFEIAQSFVAKHHCFHMFIVSKKQVASFGFTSFQAFAEKLKTLDLGTMQEPYWGQGVYFLTDPEKAEMHCVLGIVSSTFFESIENYWEKTITSAKPIE